MKIFRKQDTQKGGVLLGLKGEYAEAIFRMDRDEVITIGRDPKTSHIVMSEDCTHVSRTHCTIRCNAAHGTYTVHDLSTNGTFADGSRLKHNEDVDVPAGSVLAVGDTENLFKLG